MSIYIQLNVFNSYSTLLACHFPPIVNKAPSNISTTNFHESKWVLIILINGFNALVQVKSFINCVSFDEKCKL